MRNFLICFTFLVWKNFLPAQVGFSRVPSHLQMFPRDSTNYGHFYVEGQCAQPGVLRTVLSEMGSNSIIETFSLQANTNEYFSLHHKIPACLKEYKLEVFFQKPSASEQSLKLVSNLVAGDFFIVDGQSNAECPTFTSVREHDSLYFNPYTRVIGGNFAWCSALSSDNIHPVYDIAYDCIFRRPSSLPYYQGEFGYSGIWPLSLQYELANQTGIPNCFLNGSQGATEIIKHFASHTPSIPDSLHHSNGPQNNPPALLYDRMYKKLHANNAIAGVKGIFWYQGESDGNLVRDSSSKYGKRFRILYDSWKADYPALKKIFVLQLNLGCGGEYHNLVREIQRKMPEEYPDVVVMSTVGSKLTDRSSDLCHYSTEGYVHISKKLLPLVKKYIYDFPLKESLILPANIQSAYYSGLHEICLEFDKKIIIQDSCIYPKPDTGTAYLKDYFFRENSQQIRLNALRTNDHKLFLELRENEPLVSSLTYLPKIFSIIPSLYSGPWILNADNQDLGAYAFTEFPVKQYEQKPLERLIFPNPTERYLELRFAEEGHRNLFVYDLYGALIFSSESSSRQAILDLELLHTGIYLLTIQGSEGTKTSKIIVETR